MNPKVEQKILNALELHDQFVLDATKQIDSLNGRVAAIEDDVCTLKVNKTDTVVSEGLGDRLAVLEKQLTDMISVAEIQDKTIKALNTRIDIFSANEDRFLAHLGRTEERITELEALNQASLKSAETTTAILSDLSKIVERLMEPNCT